MNKPNAALNDKKGDVLSKILSSNQIIIERIWAKCALTKWTFHSNNYLITAHRNTFLCLLGFLVFFVVLGNSGKEDHKWKSPIFFLLWRKQQYKSFFFFNS